MARSGKKLLPRRVIVAHKFYAQNTTLNAVAVISNHRSIIITLVKFDQCFQLRWILHDVIMSPRQQDLE